MKMGKYYTYKNKYEDNEGGGLWLRPIFKNI